MRCHSNITDLLRNFGLLETLTQCGIHSQKRSDYELFRALCGSIELLPGHTLPFVAAEILKNQFSIDLPLDPLYCDEIWRRVANSLLQSPQAGMPRLPEREPPFLSEVQLHNLVKKIKPMQAYDAARNAILPNKIQAWSQWKAHLQDLFAAHFPLFFRLFADMTFEKPNLYRVETALQASRSLSKETDSLLALQALREGAVWAKEKQLPLLLSADCSVKVLEEIVFYLGKEIGSLEVICCPTNDETMQYFCNLTQKCSDFRLGLSSPSEELLRGLAPIYPLGRIVML